jgi:predicted nucleic acid-binding protein
VLDTSVAINLVATGCPSDIIQALPFRWTVVDIVLAELEDGREHGWPHADLVDTLVDAGSIDVVGLGDMALPIFQQLVTGAALDTLDDGEAATIAYAVAHGAVAAIDERKAIRICRERFPSTPTAFTTDILARSEVLRALGRESVNGGAKRGQMAA